MAGLTGPSHRPGRMAHNGTGMKAQQVCRVCGRRFGERKKWARNWDQVRYCSAACRQRGLRPIDRKLETELLALLAERPADSSICPSELARRLESDEARWRALLEPIRMAVRRLCHAGEVTVLQSGRAVDPDTACGPIRLRRIRTRDPRPVRGLRG